MLRQTHIPSLAGQSDSQPVDTAGFDPEAAKHTEGEFKRKGIHMNPDFSPVKVVKDSDGKLTMTAKNNDDKETTLDGIDYILMATGRKPSTQGLGLEKVWQNSLLLLSLLAMFMDCHTTSGHCSKKIKALTAKTCDLVM